MKWCVGCFTRLGRFFLVVGLLLGVVAFGLVATGNDSVGNALAALVNPPSVSTDNATAGGYTAWLFGNLDQRGTASTVNASFQWRTGLDAWNDTPAQLLADNYTGPFSFNLTGLSTGTTYEYRAHAIGDGEAFGLTNTFTTVASPIAPIVVTVDATNISYSSAGLGFRFLQEGTAPSGNVSIEWGLAPDQLTHEIGPFLILLNVPGMGFGPGFPALTRAGLTPGTTYYFQAKAVGDGISFGEILNFTTLSSPPVPPAVGDYASDLILVRFKDGTDEYTELIVHRKLGGLVTIDLPQIGYQVVQVPWGTVLQKVAEYQSEPTVKNAGLAFGGSGAPVTSSPTPSGGGSGGGGGGGSGTTVVSDIMAGNKFIYPATVKSIDQKVNINIPKGTVANVESGRLTSISVFVQKDLPESVASWGVDLKAIGVIYNIQPDGATFDPPINLTIKYNSEDAKQIPKGVDEKNLVIGTYDIKTGKWTTLDSVSENGAVTTKIGHFSLYTIMARTAPASFKVSDLTVTPQAVTSGENIAASVAVANDGDLNGSYKLDLKIDGRIVETKEVTVDGRNTETISFDLPTKDAGTHTVSLGGLEGTYQVIAPRTPAAFAVSGLTISPGEVKPGDKVNISVTVTNTGQTNGTYSLLLKINGNTVDAKEAILAGGASDSVVFTASGETAGEYAVDINGTTASFIVKEGPTPAIGPTTNPTPVPEAISPIKTSGANWQLIVGSVLGVVVVGSVMLLVLRKRTKSPN